MPCVGVVSFYDEGLTAFLLVEHETSNIITALSNTAMVSDDTSLK